ncbi:hypothetical protein A4R26_10205 [Niastella populi]|uniref:Uncharacterized protein n=1 Tax=Niastella populi TaxID=550983 RepID=A0A1V9GB29_9BACT|nr:hypothetical protein A4R26_10205 [Niastella populi]
MAIGCRVVNTSRKSAGISKQGLYKNGAAIEPTFFWSHYDATQRSGLYLITPDNKVKVISEPPPDAATNKMLDVLAKTNVKDKVEAEAKVSAVKSVAELGKRTVAINFVRDIGFRIEALLNNNTTIDANTVTLYTLLLEKAKEISLAESNTEVVKNKVDILKELNLILSKADSTAPKLSQADLIKEIENVIK